MTPEEKVAWDMYFAEIVQGVIAHAGKIDTESINIAVKLTDAMLIERRKRYEK